MNFLPRRFYIFLILLLAFQSNAQHRTTVFQGRTLNVFPYRIQNAPIGNYDFKDDNFNLNVLNIFAVPFCPEPLSDGEYIAYYQPNFDYSNPKEYRRVLKGDTFLVAITFNIKNGLKEGPVSFYDYDVSIKPFVTGYYKEDLKSGNWIFKHLQEQISGTYVSGKLEGDYFSISAKPKYKLIANFLGGKLNGRKEVYYNGELQEYNTWRKGVLHGPYYRAWIDEKKLCELSGYKIAENTDSIVSYSVNGKVEKQIINQVLPFKEMDTSEGSWFVNLEYLRPELNDIMYNSYESEYSVFDYVSPYQKIIEYDKLGRAHIYFLKNNCLKIPFVVFSQNGDTTMRFSRGIQTDSTIEINCKTTNFSIKGTLTSESLNSYKIPLSATKSFYIQPIIQNIYTANYYNGYMQYTYVIRRPLPEYKGMVIKSDSTVYRFYKSDSSSNSTVNSYFIFGINKAFTIYGNDSTFGSAPLSFSYPDFRLKMRNDDTLEIKEYQNIGKDLNVVVTSKVSINDTLVHYKGDPNVMNPFSFMGYLFGASVNMVGISDYVLMYKEKPYTGAIKFKMDSKRRVDVYDFKQTIKRKNNILYITRYVHAERKGKIVLNKIRIFFRGRNDYMTNSLAFVSNYFPLFDLDLNYKNGRLNGGQTAIDKKGNTIFELNFLNGMSHQQQQFCLGKTTISQLNVNEILSYVNYDSGRVNGILPVFNNENDLKRIVEFKQGKLNGIFLEFNPDTYKAKNEVCLKTTFNHDTIDGDFTTYKNGLLFEQMHFDIGKANGWYKKYRIQQVEAWASDSAHNDQAYQVYYPEVKVKFKDNSAIDTIYGFFEDGGIKYRAVVNDTFQHEYFEFDIKSDEDISTLHFKSFANIISEITETEYDDVVLPQSHYVNFDGLSDASAAVEVLPASDIDVWLRFNKVTDAVNFTSLDIDPLYMGVDAHFTFYYKNGRKSQEGDMLANSKKGIWKYYSENGELIKEINYVKGIDSSSQQVFSFKGKLTTFYPNGKKMLEGYIVDESFSYQCNQELEITYEDIVFTAFYDSQEQNTFNNGNCAVQDIHMNGQKRYSGQITNGQKSGLWKYYDQSGHLESIGEFVNGQKDGRWLSGDLGGINFIDNACSINEALSLIKEREMHDIEIIETMYETGIIINTSHLYLEKY